MSSFLAALGRPLYGFCEYFGGLALLVREMIRGFFTTQPEGREIIRHIVRIGFGSQMVVMVTGAFTGAVFTAQSYFKFKEFGIESTVGALVAVAMFRELGPVLTGLMISGRMGASMAAELGTMKVGEQIDALRVLGIHPVDYLVNPRMVAMIISAPLLVAESVMLGIAACWYVTVHVFAVSESDFLRHLYGHTGLGDVLFAVIKGLAFGIQIVIISCHMGLSARNGAVGVGVNTTKAVVNSSLAILISNFFLTFLLNSFFPIGASGE